MRNEYKVFARIGFLFVMMYLTGALFAGGVNKWRESRAKEAFSSSAVISEAKNWGLNFKEPGTKPSGNTSVEELAKENGCYVGNTNEKNIYLTFDAGYENGNTPAILDTLKKHNVSATFFIVGNYLETCPELVKRMAKEGHTVGNHSYHHPDMTVKSSGEFEKELKMVEEKYKEITGKELDKFYRPPQGKYDTRTLRQAKEMGYLTCFWSLAYVDWLEDQQPSREEALKKLTERIHPGAIVLLHSTSRTNAEILDELLSKWEEMGYTVKSLKDFK